MRHTTLPAAAAVAALASTLATNVGAAPACRATSGPMPPAVVELYTSEGCSACPPAERWLSSLTGRPGVIALAFHVDYWDRLGWADRFASPENTARQHAWARQAGNGTVYTPQVLLNGQDWRGWRGGPGLAAGAAASPVRIALTREGETVTAQVGRGP
ncbi:MAG: DUF1223 domain-containing protein, partial [Burkholderiales bacterium]|nr:DUF1223 domain-containing protein [Burkholderiales bacterium]